MANDFAYDIHPREVWREIKHISGNIARQGWRPLFCFACVFIAWFSYVVAPQRGVEVNLDAVNYLMTLFLGAFVTRTVEKVKERKEASPAHVEQPGPPQNALLNIP